MVWSAAPPSRARKRVSEPLCHVLLLTSKRRAVGSPRVAFLAARRYFLLPSARPLRRGKWGGVAGGEVGTRRWGGWRRRRPAWLAARPQPTCAAERKSGGCGEPTGPGCAVFVKQGGAPGGDRLHLCFCMICLVLKIPSDHLSEVARAEAIRCACALLIHFPLSLSLSVPNLTSPLQF